MGMYTASIQDGGGDSVKLVMLVGYQRGDTEYEFGYVCVKLIGKVGTGVTNLGISINMILAGNIQHSTESGLYNKDIYFPTQLT